MHYFQQKVRAFTLVELIVVITILAILSTIGFVSYSSYLTSARDSNRISQMKKLGDSLQVYSTTKSLPLPDDYVTLTASGANNVVLYQGDLGSDVLETIEYENGGLDPKDNSYYTYMVTRDRSSLQLMALMEESISSLSPTLQQSYAVDYASRIPKVYGRKLGILTNTENTPIQKLNIPNNLFNLSNPGNTFIAHLSDNKKIEGTNLSAIIPDASCKRIKETGGAGKSGIYEINPAGNGKIKVYCDMETQGGGWTLYAHSYDAGTAWGQEVMQGAPYQNTNLGDVPFSSVMLASYDGVYDIIKTKIQNTSTLGLTVDGHTLGFAGITGGSSGDGFNGEQGMIFVK